MQTIYQAANLADAHLLRQLLQDTGIPVHLNGEYLQGALGEVPPNTPILLMVPDQHAEAARAIVLDWERATPQHDEATEDDALASKSAIAPASRGGSVFATIGSLLFGAVCGAAIVAGDRVDRVEVDRNRDDRIDQILRYRAKGDLGRIENDDDLDGRFERIDVFRNGQPDTFTIDHDGDGETDVRGKYENGVIVLDEWLDRSGRVVKTVRYRDGWPVSGEFDSDGDGRLDTARTYDARGEIVGSRPLPARDAPSTP
jgi:hypothetical protein